MFEVFRIVFLGISCFVHMDVAGDPMKRMIMPNLSQANAPIGRHVAFVMFPAAAYDGNDGWGTPHSAMFEGQEQYYFLLDGDELSLNENVEKLTVQSGYETFVPKLRSFCPDFTDFSREHLFTADPAIKIAQMDVADGSLRARTMFAGMIGSELTVKTGGNLVITARSWRNGEVRSVRILPGAEVWIGNMSEAFFDPHASHDKKEPHFKAYYGMATNAAALACQDFPGADLPDDRTHHLPFPGGELGKDFNVTCSNSNYP